MKVVLGGLAFFELPIDITFLLSERSVHGLRRGIDGPSYGIRALAGSRKAQLPRGICDSLLLVHNKPHGLDSIVNSTFTLLDAVFNPSLTFKLLAHDNTSCSIVFIVP